MIQIVKDWWANLSDGWKMGIAFVGLPGFILGGILVVMCLPVVILTAAFMDTLNEWSSK